MLEPCEALRMANHQIPSHRQVVGHLLDEMLLRLFVKVDHDVATEDEIKRAGKGIALLEVQTAKRDDILQLAADFIDFPILLTLFAEVHFLKIGRNLGNPVAGINPVDPHLQNPGGDVRGEDLEIPLSVIRQLTEDTHCEAVGFFTRRATGTPDPETQVSLLHLALNQLGESRTFEKLEVLGFAEKIGEIGGDAVKKMNDLTLVVR